MANDNVYITAHLRNNAAGYVSINHYVSRKPGTSCGWQFSLSPKIVQLLHTEGAMGVSNDDLKVSLVCVRVVYGLSCRLIVMVLLVGNRKDDISVIDVYMYIL